MMWKFGTALAVMLLGAAVAPAQDAKVFKLGLGDASAFALERNTDNGNGDDTELVHRRYYGYGGGYRSYYGYGYRPYYGYRSGVSINFGYGGYYRPSYYYRPAYSYYYATPSYYYATPSYYYYCPIVLRDTTVGGGLSGSPYGGGAVEPMKKADDFSGVPPVPPEENGRFRYDGGPSAPVPLPGAAPIPQKGKPIDPAQGRLVSIPAEKPKYMYAAYGEKAVPVVPPTDRPVLVNDDVKTAKR